MKRSKPQSGASRKQQKLPFAPVVRPISTVGEAIKCLKEEKNSRASKERILHSLLTVQNASADGGLSPENIITLVDIIGSQKLTIKSNVMLTKFLSNQKENIPEDSMINAVSWLCTQKLHPKVQVNLAKWILQAHDAVEQKQNFSYLYGVIFSLMVYDTLVPFLGPLLCKMTEECHVAPFRIRRLLDILSRSGEQLHILSLLGVFSHFRRDLLTIQVKIKNSSRSLGALLRSLEKVPGNYHLEGRNHRRKEADVTEMVRHEKIRTFPQFYDAAQNLNTPKGLLKLLTSPKRRILFTSGLPAAVLSQFRLWLRHSLATEKPLKQNPLSAERRDILILASNIIEELQESIPEVEGFVQAYLTKWNGHSHCGLLLDLIKYWKFNTFENLHEYVLLPIFKYFRASSVAHKCSVLECYTKLYQRWALWEVKRHEHLRIAVRNGRNLECQQITVFEQELRSDDPYRELKSLASYVDSMCVVALQLHPNHPPVLLHQIMTFFEVMVSTHSLNNKAPLVLPSSFIVCAAIFASNAASVSQLCSLIISYKKVIDDVRVKNAEQLIEQELISNFNSCILDICNILWRCYAFRPNKESLLFHKEVPLHIQQTVSEVSNSFCLYHHPALFGFALDFLHKSQTEAELPDLLNDETTREAYLAYLLGSGLKSIVSFISTFIKPVPSRGGTSRKSK